MSKPVAVSEHVEMKDYTYEEIFVGQEESFEFEITDRQMQMFAEISGDLNPLHTSDEYANKRIIGGGGKVVYGMLTATFLSTLAGMYLPGRRSLIYETEIKFTKPIHPNGGKLTLKATVTEKQDRFKRITLKVRLTDTAGATVLRATMKVGVAAREEEPRRSPMQPGVSEDV